MLGFEPTTFRFVSYPITTRPGLPPLNSRSPMLVGRNYWCKFTNIQIKVGNSNWQNTTFHLINIFWSFNSEFESKSFTFLEKKDFWKLKIGHSIDVKHTPSWMFFHSLCLPLWMHIFVYVYTCITIFVPVHVCLYMQTSLCTCLCMSKFEYLSLVPVSGRLNLNTYLCTCLWTSKFEYLSLYVSLYVFHFFFFFVSAYVGMFVWLRMSITSYCVLLLLLYFVFISLHESLCMSLCE